VPASGVNDAPDHHAVSLLAIQSDVPAAHRLMGSASVAPSDMGIVGNELEHRVQFEQKLVGL
jgi:hypothetical protein